MMFTGWINGVDEKAKVRLLQETGTSPLQPSGYEFTVQGDAGHHDWQVCIVSCG